MVVVLVKLVVCLVLLRFWLQLVRADFYNPVSQAIVKSLAPVIRPLQMIVPVVGRCNLAVLVLAVGIHAAFGYFYVFSHIGWWQLLAWSVLQTVSVFLMLLFWLLIGSVIASWLASQTDPPAVVRLIHQSIAPIVDPVRRVIPAVAGLDFSPIVVFFAIQLARNLLLENLYQLAGVPSI